MWILHDIARLFDEAWWGFEHFTGGDNASGPEYGMWSGFLSDIAEFALLGGAIHFARSKNCHVKRCWRLGLHKYDHDGVERTLCKKHHPHLRSVTHDEIQAHAAAGIQDQPS